MRSPRSTCHDRGSASVELVVLMPLLLLILFAGVQGAVYYHARTLAIAAAQEGARAAARENATTEGKPVSARLTPAEIEQLEWVKSRFGYGSNSDAIRALVRAASGMLEFDPVTASRLTEVKTELHKIGVNVNQVAFAAIRGKIDLTRQEWKALDAVRQALPGVRIYLQAVVDEQRRRGTRLFQKFVESGRG